MLVMVDHNSPKNAVAPRVTQLSYDHHQAKGSTLQQRGRYIWNHTDPQKPAKLIGHLERNLPKAEIPIFLGENCDGWIYKAKRYYQINKISISERLESLMLDFGGNCP